MMSLLWSFLFILLLLSSFVMTTVLGQESGTLTGQFWLVPANLDPFSEIKPLGIYDAQNAVIDVSSFTGIPFGLVVPTTCCFHHISFLYSGVSTNDMESPYAMGSDISNGNNFTEIPSLRINGKKMIWVKGYDGVNYKPYANLTLKFTVIGGITASILSTETSSPISVIVPTPTPAITSAPVVIPPVTSAPVVIKTATPITIPPIKIVKTSTSAPIVVERT